jgi:hypothetical protein
MHVHTHIYIYTCTYMNICINDCIRIDMYLCKYLFIYYIYIVNIYMYTLVSIYILVSAYTHICMYMNICSLKIYIKDVYVYTYMCVMDAYKGIHRIDSEIRYKYTIFYDKFVFNSYCKNQKFPYFDNFFNQIIFQRFFL